MGSSESEILRLKDELDKTKKKLKLYKKIIDYAPANIYWKDTNHIYHGCNLQQALEAGCKTVDEFEGKTIRDILSSELTPEDREAQAKQIEQADEIVFNTGDMISVEESVVLKDGKVGKYLSKKIPLKNNVGVVEGLIGVTVDITNYKKLEASLEKHNKFLEAIIDTFSKLLKNPISSISGLSQYLLLKDCKAKDINTLVTSIDKSSENILDLINRIADYVRILGDKSERYQESINVLDMLYRSVRKTLTSNQKITTKNCDTLDENLILDGDIFTQTIQTLTRYCLTYSSQEDPIIEFNVLKNTKKHIRFKIEFVIKSTSLSKINKESAFNVFNDVTNNLLVDQSLELSIIHELAVQNDFAIDYSVNHEHTSIWLEGKALKSGDMATITKLPASISADKSKDFQTSAVDQFKNKHLDKKLYILVVEDDSINANAIKLMLESMLNADVSIAESLYALKKIVNKKSWDAIFMDVNLPDGNGFDGIQLLKNKSVPVIVNTANDISNEDTEKKFIDSGATDIIEKPISYKKLMHTLERTVFKSEECE